MEKKVDAVFASFDTQRKIADARQADEQDGRIESAGK